MLGEDFKLQNDDEILAINSPKSSCGGPYIVVSKSLESRWAIIALDWDGVPTLGIRWFWGTMGNPISSGYATWFIVPAELHNAVLNGLPLSFMFRKRINRFLAGEINGNQLSTGGKK